MTRNNLYFFKPCNDPGNTRCYDLETLPWIMVWELHFLTTRELYFVDMETGIRCSVLGSTVSKLIFSDWTTYSNYAISVSEMYEHLQDSDPV